MVISATQGEYSAADQALEEYAVDTLSISGIISFETVLAFKKQGEEFLRSHPSRQCIIELSNVASGGSAAISLLLSWLRYSKDLNIQLSYCNLPADMLNVAQLSGVDQLLPVHAG